MKATSKICLWSILLCFSITSLYLYLTQERLVPVIQAPILCTKNKVKVDCNESRTDALSLLILIESRDDTAVLRAVQRNGPIKHVWLDCTGRPITINWRFTVTKPKNSIQFHFNHVMYAESKEHHDVFMSYYWLSDMRLVHLEEALRQFNFDYVVKIKEDTLLNPSMLYNRLLNMPRGYFVYGGVFNESNRIEAKLYNDRLEAVSGEVIQYVDPSFTVMSRAVVQNILSVAHHIPYVDQEAEYIGMLGDKLKIGPTKLDWGYTDEGWDEGCVNGYSSYFTGLGSEEMEAAFERWTTCGNYC